MINMKLLLEQAEELASNLEEQYANSDPLEEISIPTEEMSSNDELLDDLNTIFTPILIMQSLEGDITEKVQEGLSEDNILTERSCLKFDNSARMAQLLSTCALLLSRQKNSPKWQMFKKASEMLKATKLEIQREEAASAQALAQRYLVKVSTSSNSSIARKAASDLLPFSN